jgi:glycosyltransferase involved in cell wall biosynthesis
LADRILYFSRDYTTHDHRFMAALAQADVEVYYLRLERRGHQLEDRPLPAGIRLLPWEGGQVPARWQDGPRLLTGLRRVLRRVQPNLVQAGSLQTAAFLTALSGFQPLVSMSWGYDLLIEARRDAFYRLATCYTLRRSAALVGDCDTIRQLAVSFGMPAGRIVTFPWGVDLAHFRPGPGPHGGQEFTLLSTRAWEPIYGVEVIAQAFVSAARECPELRLVMLGNGSLAARLRQIYLGGGVLERVSFPGHINQADLPHYYRMADLYLSASHSDGSSISLLEAMACGLPVLVSDIPGNREWVTPGENGWWFPDGDVPALAEAILAAVAQRRRLPGMGSAGRALVEQRADWKKNFPRLFEAYALALGRPLEVGNP